LRDLRGKAAKIREKRDGIEGYGDGILSTPVADVVEEVVAVSEPTVTDVVAEVPAQDVTTEVVSEAVDVVAEVPAEGATTDVVSEEAAENKPAE
jgi:hypothetical protein